MRDAPPWRRAFSVMKAYPEETMLPLLVTQGPLAVLNAVVYFVLYQHAYPQAKYDTLNPIGEAPPTLVLWLVLTNAVYSLFTLVGAAATMVSVRAALAEKPLSLSKALDPAFTRMGGLLVLGVLFNVMLGVTLVGIIVVLYLVIRFGLAFHVYILGDAHAMAALGRSWQLLRGRMLRFVGVLISATPVIAGVVLAGSLAMGIALAPFVSDDLGRTATISLNAVAFLVFGLLAVPIGAYVSGLTTIFYLDITEEAHA